MYENKRKTNYGYLEFDFDHFKWILSSVFLLFFFICFILQQRYGMTLHLLSLTIHCVFNEVGTVNREKKIYLKKEEYCSLTFFLDVSSL